jgi:glycosyltransferase involved in cell wall biosynthesis
VNICLFGDARSAHLHGLARHLSACGQRVHVVTHKPAEVPGASVERFRVPPPGVRHPFRWQRRWSRYLSEFMQRFDVVNVHFLLDWGFTPDIMRLGRFVATAWGSDIVIPPGEDAPSPELAASRINVLRHADAITTCGPTFAATVAEYAGLAVDRIDVLPFGVDLERFTQARTPDTAATSGRAEEPKEPIVGYYKGFRPVYGPETLIRAIPLVVKACPQTRFELIGEGTLREPCAMLADRLGVADRIVWLPRQGQSHIAGALSRWTLSVIPSVCEAFGVAALESSAMGVPVIASDIGGLRDTVRDGETGLRVPPHSPEALAGAIIALLRDERCRRKMAQIGRRWVRDRYDWCRIVHGWIDLYHRISRRSLVPA